MTSPSSGSYQISEINRNIDKELERLHIQTVLGWQKEARSLTWFGLRDGMSILELGSGPGFVTEQLLQLAPTSSITGLEIDPVMNDQAERYLRDMRGDRVRLVEASIMAIPLPDNSYDFALARFLFQHLPDPSGAAKEVLRVLKPGGKLVINDIDEAIGGLTDPQLAPEINAIFEKAGSIQTSKGGNTRIGRRLPRILRDAGFDHLDLDIMAVHSDLVGMAEMAPLFDVDLLWPALQAGVITEEDYALVQTAFTTYRASPESIDMYTLLFACGQKPLT